MPIEFLKDPAAVLDYKWDWRPRSNGSGGSDWLAVGETISSALVTPAAGLTLNSSAVTDAGTSVTAWLSGGTPGKVYPVVCKIVTSAGRTDERTINIKVFQL